jgi:hypothetical protein
MPWLTTCDTYQTRSIVLECERTVTKTRVSVFWVEAPRGEFESFQTHFFFEKGEVPASASIDAYGFLLKII